MAVTGVVVLCATGTVAGSRAANTGPVDLVSGRDELDRALRRNGTRTIKLRPGDYGELKLAADLPPGHISLVAEDAARRPRFSSVVVFKREGVTLDGLDVRRTAAQPVRQLLAVLSSRAVTLKGVSVAGPATGDRGQEYAMMIRDSHGVVVEGCTITRVRYGIGLLDGRDVKVIRNEVHDVQTDGIRGGGTSDLLLAENVVGALRPKPGEHPDGIQLWTNQHTRAAERITIRDNVVVRAGGGIMQGIFVTGKTDQARMRQVVVRDNMVIGAMYNGILVAGADQVDLQNNTVVAYTDMKSRVSVAHAANVSLTNNRAAAFLYKSVTNKREAGSTAARAVPVGDVGALRTWLRTRRAGPGEGRFLTQLLQHRR